MKGVPGHRCDANATRGDPRAVLDRSGVLASIAYYDARGDAVSDLAGDAGLAADALAALCNPGHIGDMFQATSTNDPAFWLLHGNIDRIWHLKRLVARNRTGYDDAWAGGHACYGHNPGDRQPWTAGDLGLGRGNAFLTNADLYARLHPTAGALPYVYDNFKWPHCDITGHDMLEAALFGLGNDGPAADAAAASARPRDAAPAGAPPPHDDTTQPGGAG